MSSLRLRSEGFFLFRVYCTIVHYKFVMSTIRMPGKSKKTTAITVRVPNELLAYFRKKAKRKRVSVASLVVKSLSQTRLLDNADYPNGQRK